MLFAHIDDELNALYVLQVFELLVQIVEKLTTQLLIMIVLLHCRIKINATSVQTAKSALHYLFMTV